MNKNTGGPAFPCDRIPMLNGTAVSSDGMTLRDYFAAKAMQTICTDQNSIEVLTRGEIADLSYRMADAMLKARK